MRMRRFFRLIFISYLACLPVHVAVSSAQPVSEQFKGRIFDVGKLKPVDSSPKLKVGDMAPDFSLPALSGDRVHLSQFRGKKNIVISFVPAAWTPVCSEQWPGYNILKDVFEKDDAILLGISV